MPKKPKVTPKDSSHTSSNATKVPVTNESEPVGGSSEPKESSTPTPSVVNTKAKSTRRPIKPWVWWAIGGGVVLVAGAVVAGVMLFKPTPTANSNTVRNTNVATGDLVPRQLDGVLVAPEKANPNIYAVMIENLTDSRPPSGLNRAPVVYEALAEGGITRFLALFLVSETISEIGPVRSARPYYVSWAEEYRPLYIHAGGSPQAIDRLRSSNVNVVDFNQFTHGPNFWRDKNRVAPHNLYTSTDKLFLGLKAVAPDLVPNYTSWDFQDGAALEQRGQPANKIVIDYSAFNYQVTYEYHRDLNTYFRFLGDKPHVTSDGQTIVANNVIVEFMKTGLISGESQRLQMETVGEGRMLLFRDGQTIEGTWKKTGPSDRTQFLDAAGQPVKLDRGMTWISAVPTDRQVTY